MLNLYRIQVLMLLASTWSLPHSFAAEGLAGAQDKAKQNLESAENKDLSFAACFEQAMQAMQKGQTAQAEVLLKKCLKMEAGHGASEKDKLKSTLALADLYRSQSKYAESEALYKSALSRYQSSPEQTLLPVLLSKLGGLYKSSGQLDLALSNYKQALSLVEKQSGASSAECATAHANLGLLYQKMGKKKEAESEELTALKIFQEKLGKESPESAQCMSDLATFYLQDHNSKKAIPLFQSTLAVLEKHSPNSLSFATCADQLGTAYTAEGKYAESEELARKALSIYETLLGPSNKEVAVTLSNLGYRLAKQGKHQEAIDSFKRSIKIQEKLFGPFSAELLANLHGLVEVYVAQADYAKAEPILRRDLALREKQWGQKSISLVPALRNLANCLILEGKSSAEPDALLNRAEMVLQEVPEGKRKTVESMISPDLVQGLNLSRNKSKSKEASKNEPW